MATVTVSPKYQVVIPSALRRALGIRPGQKIEVLAYEGRIEFVPVRPMKAMRGFLSGLDTRVPREDDRV
ncbi:MAG: AbrB/MazE/SpoVT family DNA-binding domain-containing protein [Gammaproteobacteria bacterium]